MRAAFAHELDQVELVPRDRRIFKLAVFSDLGHDAAQRVVFFYGRKQSFVGYVHAVYLAQPVQHVFAQLFFVMLQRVIFGYKGRIDVAYKELFVIFLYKVQHLKVLVAAVHHAAGLCADQRRHKVVAALDRALQQAA